MPRCDHDIKRHGSAVVIEECFIEEQGLLLRLQERTRTTIELGISLDCEAKSSVFLGVQCV